MLFHLQMLMIIQSGDLFLENDVAYCDHANGWCSFKTDVKELRVENKRFQDEVETLKQLCKHYELTIECQGRETLRRHEFLCEVKEVLDKYFKEDV